MKKRLFLIICTLVLAMAMAACGGGGGNESTPAEEEEIALQPVTSVNGVVEVTPANASYEVETPTDWPSVINLNLENSAEGAERYITIEATSPDITVPVSSYILTSFEYEKPYTIDMLNEDLDKYMKDNPDSFTNLQKVTIAGVEYIRFDDSASRVGTVDRYLGVTNDKPVEIIVSGDDIIGSDEVTQTLESIKYHY